MIPPYFSTYFYVTDFLNGDITRSYEAELTLQNIIILHPKKYVIKKTSLTQETQIAKIGKELNNF